MVVDFLAEGDDAGRSFEVGLALEVVAGGGGELEVGVAEGEFDGFEEGAFLGVTGPDEDCALIGAAQEQAAHRK